MTTSRDLLLAILSMDAYNQGYARGVEHGSTRIGTATFSTDSGEELRDESKEPLDQPAGFYAVAYDVAGLGTVISYRGTGACPRSGVRSGPTS